MKEITGDMWDMYKTQDATMFCVTTNGVLNSESESVMGAGVALQCKKVFPWVPRQLGRLILFSGNNVYYLGSKLISFPTKNNWKEKSTIDLIVRSSKQLMYLKTLYNWKTIILPRPGCANGGLNWNDVCPTISSILDDDILIITN